MLFTFIKKQTLEKIILYVSVPIYIIFGGFIAFFLYDNNCIFLISYLVAEYWNITILLFKINMYIEDRFADIAFYYNILIIFINTSHNIICIICK